uniref:Replication factor A C-terminal domain-containing protein n=1 Tax=Brassica oleracea var. oleracea TaxID=109376 RepID=A0A0D3CUZ9_BRAOL
MTSSGASVANAAVPNVAGAYSTFNTLRLDEQDSVIHGFIPANRASQFRSCLKAGSIVRLDGFEVARVAHMYKITELQFVIRFIPSTRIVEVLADALVIKSDKFLVRRIDHLQVLANSNLELPDVVGEIRSVQGYDLQNDAATSRIVVCLLFEPTVTVNVSLWDEAASAFRGLLRAEDKSQSVMLVTSVNPKLFGAQVYSCVDTLEGIKKKELVSIRDLNNFISNSNEQSFVSCTGCHKKLERLGTSLNCTRCVTSDVAGVVRFRVELAVDDGNDSATFVVSNGREEYLPSCLEELTGKEFVFQIRVTPFNFSPNHRTFTVSTITEDSTIANQMKHVHVTQEHSEGIIPNGSGDVGLTASSSGPSVLGFKNGEECVSAAPPENADTLKKRKRNHE